MKFSNVFKKVNNMKSKMIFVGVILLLAATVTMAAAPNPGKPQAAPTPGLATS